MVGSGERRLSDRQILFRRTRQRETKKLKEQKRKKGKEEVEWENTDDNIEE